MFYLVLLYFLLKLTFIKYYWQFSATIVLCFGTRRQVVFKMFNIWSVRRSSSKNLTQIVHLNGKIFFLLTKGLLIKVSLVRRSQSDIFSSRESYVFRHVSASYLRNVYCLRRSEDACGKKDFIWHKSFIWMVKHSYFCQLIVYQTFYGALLKFSYPFFKKKVDMFWHALASRFRNIYCLKRSEDPCWKSDISCFVWLKSFIQAVKYFFFRQWIVYQGLYDAMLTSRKSTVFRPALASRFLGPCLLHVEKMLSFNCVCSLKMGLLKHLSPVLTNENQ